MSRASNPAECGIKVFCRVRPLNEMEMKAMSKCVVSFSDTSYDTIYLAGKAYAFDKVFKPYTPQQQVYKEAAFHIVQDVLSGYNGTVFAYGQTSSGKTHTMEGIIGDPEKEGIIPRMMGDIFTHIESMDAHLVFHIKVSFFEVYNEHIRDLLDVTKTNLSIREDKRKVPYVMGLTEKFVASPEEIIDCINVGNQNRHIAVTDMNEHSSRSHSVFLVHVIQENAAERKKLTGKLFLVDLAGSEKVSKTGAEGVVLNEAKNINRSLSALGNVVAALSEKRVHIPYRDSKLTRILEDSLGGNSRTTILICCSPSAWNEAETKSTLLFGLRAKAVKNVAVVNEDLSADEWKRRYEGEVCEVTRLMSLLADAEAELNRWKTGEKGAELAFPFIGASGDRRLTQSLISLPDAVDSVTRMSDFSSLGTAVSDLERRKFDSQVAKLFDQLDEKDDEISEKCQRIERMEAQIKDQEEILREMRIECERTQAELSQAEKEKNRLEEVETQFANSVAVLFTEKEEMTRDLDLKDKLIERLTTSRREQCLISTTLQSDLKKLTDEASEYKKRLEETARSAEIRELAEKSLRGEEKKVAKQLESLRELRLMFVATIDQQKVLSSAKEPEVEFAPSEVRTQTVAFLERNLAEITERYKQVFRTNIEQSSKLLKSETRLRATADYVKVLEDTLRDVKQKASSDKKKYGDEVKRIKEAIRLRNLAQRGITIPQIAKPIRPAELSAKRLRSAAATVPTEGEPAIASSENAATVTESGCP